MAKEIMTVRGGTSNITNAIANAPRFEAGKTEKGYSKQLAQAVLSRENAIRKNSNESLHLFDSNGKEIMAFQGKGTGVIISRSQAQSIPQNTIMTHNHPRALGRSGLASIGHSFSAYDIASAIRHNAAEIRAVTPRYTFSLKRPKGGWGISESELNKVYRNAENERVRDGNKYIDEGPTNAYNARVERANVLHHHALMKELSKKYGWIYTKKRG